MTETTKRILAGAGMILIAVGAGVAEYFDLPAVRWLTVAVIACMTAELAARLYTKGIRNKEQGIRKFARTISLFLIPYSLLLLASAYFVGGRPWIILLLLMTICCADIGAWFFGRLIKGDKMWPTLSAGKTWSGQIAGILCGTFGSVMYGLLGTDSFLPQLLWIGVGISLMSQYGDLTASWIKRRLNIKDFGTILPGHGGITDRFDGWIYALPIVWLVML
jgi:phosphatidate cytidylyltransferase